VAHTATGGLSFSAADVVLSLKDPDPQAGVQPTLADPMHSREGATGPDLQIHFVASNPGVDLQAHGTLSGTVNYLIGNDASKWHANVPTHKELTYHGLYSGIDLTYVGAPAGLKGTYTIGAGANANQIRWRYDGANNASVDSDGNLRIRVGATRGGHPDHILVEQAPVAWQEIGSQRIGVDVHYAIHEDGTVGFALGRFDGTMPLVIDPMLSFSTYLGGSGSDVGWGITTDAAGNVYVTGETASSNFVITPETSPYQPRSAGGSTDVFVTKMSPTGDVFFSTYLGGSGQDWGWSIKVDSNGSAYVAGGTSSTDFPLKNPYHSSYGGGTFDGYVTKLTADGSALVYSTYLGGNGNDDVRGVQVDAAGSVYLSGITSSTDFPLANAVQAQNRGGQDAFVTKLSAAGSSLVYSTYLGGTQNDIGYASALGRNGELYLTGWTYSADFPLATPYQAVLRGGWDVFVTELNASGSALVFSTYLGGSGLEEGKSIALDGANNVYITGDTESNDFPLRNALLTAHAGGTQDAFVTKFNPTASDLVYSTYLGGSAYDQGHSIAVAPEAKRSSLGRQVAMISHSPMPCSRTPWGVMMLLLPSSMLLALSWSIRATSEGAITTMGGN